MGEPSKITTGERLAKLIRIAHRLLAVNLICAIALLPVISWFYLILNTYVHAGLPTGMVDVLPGVGYFAGLLLRLPPPVFYFLLTLSAIVSGPLLLGLHTVTGGIVQGRHMWVSDCFAGARQNARQGIALGLFCVVTGHLLLWNIFGGLSADIPWISFLFMASRWASILFFLLMGLALPFICQIAVSVEQPLWTVVKNALILSRVHAIRGFALLLLLGAYWWTTTITFPHLSLFSLPLFSITLTVLAQTALSQPIVLRHVVEPLRRMQGDTRA